MNDIASPLSENHLALAECELFQDLPEEEIATLARLCQIQAFSKHSIVIGSGDTTDSIYLVKTGRVRAFRDSEEGRQITLNTIGPGQIFGELAAISNSPRIATIETLEATETLVISRELFLDLVSRQPQICLVLVRILVDRVQAMSVDLSDIALLEVYGRVARVLQKNAEPVGDGYVVDGVTHQEIANLTGSSRETVSRVMKVLRDRQLIHVEGRRIVIHHELYDEY